MKLLNWLYQEVLLNTIYSNMLLPLYVNIKVSVIGHYTQSDLDLISNDIARQTMQTDEYKKFCDYVFREMKMRK